MEAKRPAWNGKYGSEMLQELIGILEWAKMEKAPLRKQEIEHIERLIAKATGG